MFGDPSFWRLVEEVKLVLNPPQPISEVILRKTGGGDLLLLEDRWFDIKGGGRIRIDPPHAGGQKHVHIFCRRNNEIGVVNMDGTGSHGTKVRLTRKTADALRRAGVQLRADRIVEWQVSKGQAGLELLLG